MKDFFFVHEWAEVKMSKYVNLCSGSFLKFLAGSDCFFINMPFKVVYSFTNVNLTQALWYHLVLSYRA